MRLEARVDKHDHAVRLELGSLRHVAAFVALTLALPACSRATSDDRTLRPLSPGEAVTPTPPSTTSEGTRPRVPDNIDAPYVDQVMAELDRLEGDAVKELVAKRAPTQRFDALLQAVYDEPGYARSRATYFQDVADGFVDLASRPGQPRTRVSEIVDASRDCVVARTSRSYESVYVGALPAGDSDGYVQLHLKEQSSDPAGLNPTAWSIVSDIVAEEATIPEDPCA